MKNIYQKKLEIINQISYNTKNISPRGEKVILECLDKIKELIKDDKINFFFTSNFGVNKENLILNLKKHNYLFSNYEDEFNIEVVYSSNLFKIVVTEQDCGRKVGTYYGTITINLKENLSILLPLISEFIHASWVSFIDRKAIEAENKRLADLRLNIEKELLK